MRSKKQTGKKRTQLNHKPAVSALLIAASMGGAAQAQQAPDSAKPDENVVTITGSRLVSRGFLAPTPVTVVDAQELKVSGTQNLENLLNDMSQFTGNQLNSPTANTVQAGQPVGTSTLNLRNLGATRNLVLVNGRRFAITGPDFTTDINTIPTALVKRVETVTGGSSAVYGSDAISGVVNFILRDNFQGAEINVQSNWDQPTHTPTRSVDLTVGGNFDSGKGNAVISVNYQDRKGTTRGDLGGYALPSLGDGCVTAASWSATGPGTPLAVPSGQTCLSAGGKPGLVYSGSSTVPTGRIGNLPVVGSSSSNAALDAAMRAAGLGSMTTLGAIFDQTGKTVRPYTTADAYDLGPQSYVVTPQKRWVANAFAHYDFNQYATGYSEVHFSSNRASVQLAPSGVGGNFLVNTNNPYLSSQMQEVLRQLDLKESGTSTVTNGKSTLSTTAGDGLAVLNLNRRMTDVGPRAAATDHETFRIALGVKGQLPNISDNYLSDLKYDMYYTNSRTTESQLQAGSISLSGFQNALLSQGGAAPVLNPFGQNISPAAATAVSVISNSNITAEQQGLAAGLTGTLFQLPAGPVDFSTGVERRRADARYSPDAYLASGDVAGWNAARKTEGSETVKEVFGEARIPLLTDKPFAKSLSVSGAFRRSDYDVESVGAVWTNSVGAEWSPVQSLTFRAQKQKSIRAPNVGELYGGQGTNGPTATDPCSSRQPASQQTAAVRALCQATGVPANLVFDQSIQPTNFLTQIVGGNPGLKAETSHTTTFGAVFAPTTVPGLQMSLDYYRITLDDAISTLGGGGIQSVLNLCYNTIQNANSVYCKAINRDPVTGQIAAPTYVMTTAANIGGIKTSGLDAAAHYGFRTAFGLMGADSRWNLDTNWTYVKELTFTPIQDLPNITNECVASFGPTCGQPVPHWKGTARVTWNSGKAMLSARVRYLGKVTVDTYVLPQRQGGTPPALESLTNPKIGAYAYLDLTAGYDFTKNISLVAGVRNVLDKDPPVLGSTQLPANNSIPATYDPLGRNLFFSLDVKL
ncbi:TonB-dependent receptor [Pseudoduganella sp. RAF19]|uniref:TonB-dependent receptor domain-containing protein n=1 Tax=Pseudoduganella sp. RAF19 TaxID=3233052 RepID=UPI003F9A1D3D